MTELYRKIYVELKTAIPGVDNAEFIFTNASIVDYGDEYLTLLDASEHLLLRCKLTEVERFVRFN